MTKSNPYIAGNPVGGGEAFIGRADVLRDVLRVLKNPKESGMVLYGQRRIGKTSVLQELAASLPQKGPYAPVYFDLQDKAALPLEQVLHELAERILYNLNKSPLEGGQRGVIPLEGGQGGFLKGFHQDFLPYVLSQLPEETALVLLFDEFDVLDNPASQQAGSAFFPYLRDLMSLDTKHLKFIFVIGRRPEDLSSLTLSVFKGVKSHHVSLLSQKDTVALVRLSERNDSLNWPDEAITQVYNLTGGHPYLTQQLCQVIWENIYDEKPGSVPVVQSDDIEQAIPETLKNSTSSLEWLWDGLGPAERVVASALAEAGPKVITQKELEKCLQKSGVRILISELQDAPKVLETWDLIRPENGGYCIPVDMLRRWIAQRKPLARVQGEIDRVEPIADSLFQAAYELYKGKKLEEAIPLLQNAVGLNPNHLKANQLLAEIFLAQGNFTEARKLLETLYVYNPSAALPRLIQALLTQAKEETQENEQLVLYEKVLELDPRQPEALAVYQKYWEKQGDKEFARNAFEKALEFYKKADAKEKIDKVNKRLQFEVVTVNAQGKVIQRDRGEAQLRVEELGNGIILEMVAIPGGTFLMGAPETEKGWCSDESPQHQVTVAPFFMGKYPITQEQWETVIGNNPSNFKGAKRPVEKVSWKNAVTFCKKLSKKTGRSYRLPSEAEWEYACRAGTITPFYFGETLTSALANYDASNTYASEPKDKYRKQTTEVGNFPPNAFGLYDMHGNVWEWCADFWHKNYKGAPSDGSIWESGGNASYRVLRGGSWIYYPSYCRSASRIRFLPVNWDSYNGFRVVVSSSWTLQ